MASRHILHVLVLGSATTPPSRRASARQVVRDGPHNLARDGPHTHIFFCLLFMNYSNSATYSTRALKNTSYLGIPQAPGSTVSQKAAAAACQSVGRFRLLCLWYYEYSTWSGEGRGACMTSLSVQPDSGDRDDADDGARATRRDATLRACAARAAAWRSARGSPTRSVRAAMGRVASIALLQLKVVATLLYVHSLASVDGSQYLLPAEFP